MIAMNMNITFLAAMPAKSRTNEDASKIIAEIGGSALKFSQTSGRCSETLRLAYSICAFENLVTWQTADMELLKTTSKSKDEAKSLPYWD